MKLSDDLKIGHAYEGELHPEILMHPNIPKPLHEVNPRNLMGREAWDELKREVYRKADYHCIACGVHKNNAVGRQWLEAHEFYDIDYEKGTVTIKEIVPLCHYCHNFIHSGRLSMILGEEKDEDEVIEILEHGFKILAENNLKAFYPTIMLAEQLGADTFGVQEYRVKGGDVAWGDWRLIWDGKEYPPKFKSFNEWRERFGR